MKKLRNLEGYFTGDLLYESDQKVEKTINKFRLALVLIFMTIVIVGLSLYFVLHIDTLCFWSLISFCLIIFIIIFNPEKGDRFQIYDNGFVAKIFIRPKNPNVIRDWPLGFRYVKFDEILKIYKIHPFKRYEPFADLWIRVDIAPIEKRYSCVLPMLQVVEIVPILITQIQKKNLDIIVDDELVQFIDTLTKSGMPKPKPSWPPAH